MTDIRETLRDVIRLRLPATLEMDDAADDVTDAVLALVGPKPLEFCHGEAFTEFGVYKIDSGQAAGGGRWHAWAFNPDESDPLAIYYGDHFPTEGDAQAYAQAHADAAHWANTPLGDLIGGEG